MIIKYKFYFAFGNSKYVQNQLSNMIEMKIYKNYTNNYVRFKM